MAIGLFAPCFVDRLAPRTAWAAWRLLDHLGVDVEVVEQAPACCGQPLSSMGDPARAQSLPGDYARSHAHCAHVICLSASCTAFIRHHHPDLAAPRDQSALASAPPTRTLAEFLWHDLGLRTLPGHFPHRVGIHPGCHGLRELGLAPCSEQPQSEAPDIVGTLLDSIDGLIRVVPERPDECCGFGAVSCRMGRDRLDQFADADVITSTDPSCLLHLQSVRSSHHPRLLSLPELLCEAMGLEWEAQP